METISGYYIGTGDPIAVTVDKGKIVSVNLIKPNPFLPLIAPGLIDLQINGYMGIDFNEQTLTAADVSLVVEKLFAQGVTSFLPTIITNSFDFIAGQIATIQKACSEDEMTNLAIMGYHLEGPFISPQDGPRGAHDKRFATKPDIEFFDRLFDLSGGTIVMITLSPEWEEAPDFIEHCVEKDVVVSIGHTAATSAQIEAAVQAGASMCTHLGNATYAILPRHPNYIWDQLSNDALAASFIADGFHLPDSVLKTIIKMKGDGAIMVSDSVALAGCSPGAYTTPVGGNVVLTQEGRLYLADNPGALAGSAQTLLEGVLTIVRKNICNISQAWKMASVNAADVLRIVHAEGIAMGAPADLVLLSPGDFQLLATYKNGRRVA